MNMPNSDNPVPEKSKRTSISVLSFASNRFTVDGFHEVICALKGMGFDVNHTGISPDRWYDRNSADAYASYCYGHYKLPRKSNVKTSWWYTPEVLAELKHSLTDLTAFLDEIIKTKRPHVFLIADDTGRLESFIIQHFNQRSIPVVLMVHGTPFPLLNKELLDKANFGRTETTAIGSHHDGELVVPEPDFTGLNGQYLICTDSELTSKLMLNYGVPWEYIRHTGYPYFDRILRAKKNGQSKNCDEKRILFISSGFGLFGNKEYANAYFSFLLTIYQKISSIYDVSIRLKPNEELSSFLDPDLLGKIRHLDISFDDNSIASLEALKKYDLVMGEPSLMLLESAILGIPSVLIKLCNAPYLNYEISFYSILHKVLGIVCVTAIDEVEKIISKTFENRYSTDIQRRLIGNESLIAYKLDGKSAVRISEVVIESIASKLIESRRFKEAETLISSVIAHRPGAILLLNLLGTIRSKNGQIADAKKNYLALLKSRPDFIEALQNLSHLEKREKNEISYSQLLKDIEILKPSQETASKQLRRIFQRIGASSETTGEPAAGYGAQNLSLAVHGLPRINTLRASIIIPTFNRREDLRRLLKSLLQQKTPREKYEIIIVDNGSTDKTSELVDSIIKMNSGYHIRYIYEPEPGLISGRHRGAIEARAGILVFVDDDIETDSNWLTAVLDAFEDEDVHLVGGPNLPKFEFDPPQWISKFWLTQNTEFMCGPLSLAYLGNEKHRVDPCKIWGLNYSIRKQTLFDCGGFHPDSYPKHLIHFRGDGESGLSRKLKNLNLKAVYVPQAKVFHHIPGNRLTANYFEERFFIQGISDSYSKIREHSDTTNIQCPQINLPQKTFQGGPTLNRYYENIFANILKGYQKGFDFHLSCVKKNTELRNWVLQKDYFHYKLPQVKINDTWAEQSRADIQRKEDVINQPVENEQTRFSPIGQGSSLPPTGIYNSDFYKNHKNETLRSAKIIVPLILDIFPAHSVLDFGCGTGAWLSVFKEYGVGKICGLDANNLSDGDYFIDKRHIKTRCDFSSPDFSTLATADLAICLEVAEHLPHEASENLVKNLTAMSAVIIFSAAFPGQTGVNHINEQPPWYWRRKFYSHDYVEIDYLRPLLWADKNVSWWYRQNMTAFVRYDYLVKNEKALQMYNQYSDLEDPERLTLVSEWVLKKYLKPCRQTPIKRKKTPEKTTSENQSIVPDRSLHLNSITQDSIMAQQLMNFQNSPVQDKISYYDKTKDPASNLIHFEKLKNRLIELEIPVIETEISLNDFQNWLNEFYEIKKYYHQSNDVFIEKCLEHYLTYSYLNILNNDIYIDIAASTSPWADVLIRREVNSFKLDLVYQKGINGIEIGADACDTGLPDNSCNALSLHCAYECFMGDNDMRFLDEAQRILKHNGRLAIVPLYLDDFYLNITSPLCDQRAIKLDPGAKKVWRDDQYKAPFSRHYSPDVFKRRVFDNIPGTFTAKVYYFNNLKEIMDHYKEQRIYSFFMLVCEKQHHPHMHN